MKTIIAYKSNFPQENEESYLLSEISRNAYFENYKIRAIERYEEGGL